MMYSALNLRSVLTASKAFNDSYWYLAIGYFNGVFDLDIFGSMLMIEVSGPSDVHSEIWLGQRSGADFLA